MARVLDVNQVQIELGRVRVPYGGETGSSPSTTSAAGRTPTSTLTGIDAEPSLGASSLDVQSELHEGTNAIVVQYGPHGANGTFSATRGWLNSSGDLLELQAPACSPDCEAGDWPTNQRVTYSQVP